MYGQVFPDNFIHKNRQSPVSSQVGSQPSGWAGIWRAVCLGVNLDPDSGEGDSKDQCRRLVQIWVTPRHMTPLTSQLGLAPSVVSALDSNPPAGQT